MIFNYTKFYYYIILNYYKFYYIILLLFDLYFKDYYKHNTEIIYLKLVTLYPLVTFYNLTLLYIL